MANFMFWLARERSDIILLLFDRVLGFAIALFLSIVKTVSVLFFYSF